MKTLVTGAAGFIASHVVDLLLKEGHEVWCLDDLSSGKRENLPKDIEFAKVDVGNWWDLVAEFVDCEPEYVIHLAAQPSICDSIDNPIRDGYVNVMGTLNVIRASQKIGVKRLVFSSTSAVYYLASDNKPSKFVDPNGLWKPHGTTDHPFSEFFTPLDPSSPYGISKLAAESYVRNLMPDSGTVLRFGNVYGPRQVPLGENQIIPRMIQHFEQGKEFFIHGRGLQRRDMIYVEDVARACLQSLVGIPGVYNIASGVATEVNELARIIENLYEVPGYLWEHDDQEDPRRSVCLSVDKAKNDLSWHPLVGLEEGLKKTVDWWKAQ